MNELLQQHGCANVFKVPEGLKELMADISREVLRFQPPKINDFIAKYLSALIITREHGVMAVKILDELCDCRPSVSEHLMNLGFVRKDADMLADIIKQEVELEEPQPGSEKVKEYDILKAIMKKISLSEDRAAKVCQIARNAYRDYWYRKQVMKKGMKMHMDEPWEIAAQRTLEVYKKTRPSIDELHRAAVKIQAAYKGYHTRRHTLLHLTPKPKEKKGRKIELPGPPLDVGGAREIELGPIISIDVKSADLDAVFNEAAYRKQGLRYDPATSLVHHVDSFVSPDKMTGVSTKTIKDVDSVKSTMSGAPRISFVDRQSRRVIDTEEIESETELHGENLTETEGYEIPEVILSEQDEDAYEVEDMTTEFASTADGEMVTDMTVTEATEDA